MDIAREAGAGGTVREGLRRQIDNVSRELAVLEELAAKGAGDTRPSATWTAIQTARASALQTQLTDKRTQLERLIERERALGPERIRETGRASLATWRTRSVRNRTGARFRLRRSALFWALAPVATVSIMVVSLLLGDIVARRAEPIDSTLKIEHIGEVVPAITGPVSDPGESFYSREMTVSYLAGRVFLSGQPYPGVIAMDDQMEITVTRSDGSTSTWTRTFSENCGADESLPPQDVTHLFAPGLNTVNVVLYDRCGVTRGGSGPVVLSNQG